MSSNKDSKAVNDPDSRHIDDRRILTDLHNKAPGKPCFWKHEPGTSSAECIAIPKAEYDTHPCHYRANGIKRAESEPHVYNTRPHPVLGGRARKDNREVAMLLGYIVLNIPRRKETHSKTTPEFTHLAEDIAAHKERSGAGKGMRFLDAYRGRYGKSLDWLAQDAHAWDVKHRMILHPKEFKRVYGATKDNEVKDYETDFKEVSSEIRENVWQRLGPINFHIKETNVPGGQGLGKWYPYEHDHHHMIPASAFQEYVLNGPSSKPSELNYMSRARVVMQGSWNIHSKINMILLPNEVYPARILDLAAHIPWQMGADHKPYSKSLQAKLSPIRQTLDEALSNPSEQPHDAEERAAADFTEQMTALCNEQRADFLDKGFFVLDPK